MTNWSIWVFNATRLRLVCSFFNVVIWRRSLFTWVVIPLMRIWIWETLSLLITRAALILPSKSLSQATLASHLMVVLETTFWMRAKISAIFPSLMNLSQSNQVGNPEKKPDEYPFKGASDPKLREKDPKALFIELVRVLSLFKTSNPEVGSWLLENDKRP